ncbi:MAG: thiamine pyrophosphate-dependent dehydrogenase E1 component subunit alpha [Simkania sp.]|nr:thiamine pyrophosphate-dependent dehydrogenase E1 component subunit alpha [Simkania sp.]
MIQKISAEISLELFHEMLRVRMIEEAIGYRYAEQAMRCPVHLSIGQEAVAIGVCKNILQTDYLISNHRAHAHYLAKGGSLCKMLAEIYGKVDGCSSGIGGSMHLIDLTANIIGTTPIVGGSLPVGVGVAFASLLKGENRVTVIFFGEGATEEGVWAESLNFASLKKLPILFVCENNLYSVYSPLSVRQSPKRSRVDIVRAHGMIGLQGSGNDVEEVYRVTHQAMQYIREGKGPCFVEFDTYRFREHCGPNIDDDAGYRPIEEVQYWHKKCPLKVYEERLRDQQRLTEEVLQSFRKKIQAEIDEAFIFAEKSSFPIFDPHASIYA